MLILISPAKTLNFEDEAGTDRFTHPNYLEDSEKLIKKLRRFSRKKLRDLMGISENLADLNAGRYASWEPGPVQENAKQSIFAFKGDVYQGLEIESFSEEDLEYAQSHLRILSGLYGVLKPLDMIQPYRLEMGTKLKVGRKDDLYEFWGDRLSLDLKEELQQNEAPVVFNLASNEYYDVVKPELLDATIIEPNFVDWKNGEYKVISFYLKKARGMMTAWILKHRITDPEDLKSFEMEGYAFNEELSGEDGYVFSRRQED